MAVMVPVNSVVSTVQKNLIYGQMRNKDKRSRLMDEILNGMKVLKLYAWEESFEKTITAIRNDMLLPCFLARFAQTQLLFSTYMALFFQFGI